MLTAGQLLATIRKVSKSARTRASVHLFAQRDWTREWYCRDICNVTVAVTARPEKGESIRVELPAAGRIANGHTDKQGEPSPSDGRVYDYSRQEWYEPTSGSWSLYGSMDQLMNILELLPRDARLSFHVALDAGSSGNLVQRSIHSDHLYLCVTRTVRGRDKRAEFLLDVSNGPHDTARFGGARPNFTMTSETMEAARAAHEELAATEKAAVAS